ncbi:uncharacterized protein LACBIDRAFT_306604 [Laccaria bicolor S238N-H82]|uniref:Predicted protein n=1 Tax=Laccaria bicolor (strain S238N-H82 / ATCC MYA-4686) TaxID=486041 RepID=B0DNE6_LACBS|nr:uncharacterized protein LACBIDRAFT_306604 [Laccaria bicolor S238N-H82]EDR03857.1 predicted protein [Laccaria bicolor S238N-H82]|eukprot:XP_001885425.1 predicted protein [Laccaria bicolor S238N-H82]
MLQATLSSSNKQGLRDSRPLLPIVDLTANNAGEPFIKPLQIPSITLSSDGSLASRRLSSTPGRKPLRSSPLAGPSVSPLIIIDDADHDNQSDTLKLSKPEVIAFPQIPEKTLVPRSKSFEGIMPIHDYCISMARDASPNSTLSPLDTLRRREKHKSQRPQRPRSAHSPTDAYNFSPSRDCSESATDDSARRCMTSSGPSSRRPHSFYIDPTAIPNGPHHLPGSEPHSPPLPTDNSWYIASPYDVTPRFTRLGLASSGVVLPVSAKAHRPGKPSTLRLHSSPSLSTLIPRSTIPNKRVKSAGSTPSNSVLHLTSSTPSLTLSSSNESVTDSGPPTPSPTSMTDLSAPTGTFASTTDVSLSQTSDHQGRRKFSFSRMRKSSLRRVKSLCFKSTHTNPYPSFEKEIVLAGSPHEPFVLSQAVDSSTPNKTSFLDVEELAVRNEPQSTLKPEPLPSRRGTIKRMWKSLAGGGRNRS